MDGQLSVYDWEPAYCPGTAEFEAAKNKEEQEIQPPVTKKLSKEVEMYADYEKREYWFALLAAILNPNLNSADDAINAMGIRRVTNTQ